MILPYVVIKNIFESGSFYISRSNQSTLLIDENLFCNAQQIILKSKQDAIVFEPFYKTKNMKILEIGRRSSHSVSSEWKMHVLIIT